MKKSIFLAIVSTLFIFSSCSKVEDVETTDVSFDLEYIHETGISSFTINNTDGEVFEEVPLELTNQSSDVVSYHWDFGNEEVSTEKNPSYAYKRHGVYTVTLTTTDANGEVDTSTQEIRVICLFANQDHGDS